MAHGLQDKSTPLPLPGGIGVGCTEARSPEWDLAARPHLLRSSGLQGQQGPCHTQVRKLNTVSLNS